MNIFIDESGSFVSAPCEGSWNAVAAFALPETSRKGLEQAINGLKATTGQVGKREIKLNDLNESSYAAFLAKLCPLAGALFGIVTDAGLNTPTSVIDHQKRQSAKILEHIEKMRFEGGRQGVAQMAAQITKLSPQLYVQLTCQVELMYEIVSRAITFYAQRNPQTLREIRWKIDQKNTTRTDFEDIFEKSSPALLQTMSLAKPLIMVEGFDYSHMSNYIFEKNEAPTFLQDDYGIEVSNDGALDIQKLIRGDIQFMDSQDSSGLQAVDLIVSGIRKCLRKGFQNNEEIAMHLGRLMVQAIHNGPPLRFVSFGTDKMIDEETAHLVNVMRRNAKRMIK